MCLNVKLLPGGGCFQIFLFRAIVTFVEDKMTFEQIVEIPENRRLTVEVPREIPVGPTILTLTPQAAFSADRRSARKAIEKCRGIAKGILSSDEIIAMRRKDKELEDMQYRRLFSAENEN
jgi:hypothetical protein